MSEYLAPGVFVEEVDFQPSQIQPASTSVAAMIGPARFGPVRGQPLLLTSYSDFTNTFGDAGNLMFSDAGALPNYSAYAARTFFDNGGQQLYFGRITNDVAQAGPASARPTTASLVIAGGGTNLVEFIARFPGSGGNLDLVLKPRRSPRLLQFAIAPTPAANQTVLLRLTNPAVKSLTGANLPAGTTGILSLVALATLVPSSGATPAAYDFLAGQPVLYTDQSGTPHTAVPSGFATGILASAVPATGSAAPQTVSLQAMSGIGATPIYSIPVGTNIAKLLSLPASTTTLYGTLAGTTITLPKAMNAALSTDTSVPLAVFAMGSRTGDGNIYHDAYDISVQRNGLTIYSFSGVCIEQDASNNLAVSMAQTPATGSAQAMQPIYATYTGAPAAGAIWGALLAAFDTNYLNPADPAVAPSLVLHLTGGTDGALPQADDYAGEVDEINGNFGLAALESVDVVSIVMCPAAAAPSAAVAAAAGIDPNIHQEVVSAMQAHCTKMLYRIAVIDSPPGAAVADVQQFASLFSDSRLAIYYPWVSVASLGAGGGQVLLPPSSFAAGLYAYTDITRGVHKAPANLVVQDAVGLEISINTAQQDVLNPLGINCLRQFTWGGFRVWGARTLSSDPQWQYVNVRRYFLYLEHSIADSTSWVVFEPNGQHLWSLVAQSVSDFLRSEFNAGRLFGATPAEAYFVRCDQTTMTQADIENGRLICVIGVAPLEPAEFVIFRIGQYTASASN